MHLAALCRAPTEPSLSFGVGYTTEVPLVFLFQLLPVSPASASRAGLDERPGPKIALRCGVRFRIGAVEYGAKDVQNRHARRPYRPHRGFGGDASTKRVPDSSARSSQQT